ncbi:MAG: hypothetical protein ABFS42_11245 [Candidatus Krumholzibacteriota bacterium]
MIKISRTPTLITCHALVLLLGIGGLSPAPSALAEIPVVANGDNPAAGLVTKQLEEMWRIGGEDDEDNLLGVVNQALTDDEGNVYLLDVQLVEVQVFDPDGMYVRSLGKRGDGPGEVRNAFGALFLPDGTLGLVQGFPGRIVKVDLEGLPAGEMRPGGDDPSAGGFFALRSAAAVGNHLILGGAKISRGDNSRTAVSFIAAHGADGLETARYLEKTDVREFRRAEFSEKDQFFPGQGGWTLDKEGRVYVAPSRNEYRIEVHAPGGAHERTITRQYDSWKRTDAESDRARELMMPFRRRNRNAINVVVEPTERDILAMRVDDQGNLWVLPSRGIQDQNEGIHSTWDVFDGSGAFVNQVAFACEGNGRNDALFFPGGGLAVLVREHAEAMFAFRGRGADNPDAQEEEDGEALPLEVICYKILP